MIGAILFFVGITLVCVSVIVWVIIDNRKDQEELEEFDKEKVTPLTGTAKEVFTGTVCARGKL